LLSLKSVGGGKGLGRANSETDRIGFVLFFNSIFEIQGGTHEKDNRIFRALGALWGNAIFYKFRIGRARSGSVFPGGNQ